MVFSQPLKPDEAGSSITEGRSRGSNRVDELASRQKAKFFLVLSSESMQKVPPTFGVDPPISIKEEICVIYVFYINNITILELRVAQNQSSPRNHGE